MAWLCCKVSFADVAWCWPPSGASAGQGLYAILAYCSAVEAPSIALIPNSNPRLESAPNGVDRTAVSRLAKGSGYRHDAGSSPLNYAASRRIGHPATACAPRLNITCHILRYHWNHYPNRIGRPAGTVLSQNLFQPVTLWRTGARGIHDWRRRLWQAGRVSQRFSLRLATVRARAKASALRILCCWLCRAAICA
jgi:hypothetical protein